MGRELRSRALRGGGGGGGKGGIGLTQPLLAAGVQRESVCVPKTGSSHMQSTKSAKLLVGGRVGHISEEEGEREKERKFGSLSRVHQTSKLISNHRAQSPICNPPPLHVPYTHSLSSFSIPLCKQQTFVLLTSQPPRGYQPLSNVIYTLAGG